MLAVGVAQQKLATITLCCSVSLIYSLIYFFFFGRCFCKDCLDILVGPGTFDKQKDVDPWSCYFCKPSLCDGNLKLRPDWSTKVQDFFVNNSAMEFVCTSLAPHTCASDATHSRTRSSSPHCMNRRLGTFFINSYFSLFVLFTEGHPKALVCVFIPLVRSQIFIQGIYLVLIQ